MGLTYWKFYKCVSQYGRVVVGIKGILWCMTWANFRDPQFMGFSWVGIDKREYFQLAHEVPLLYVLLKMPDMVECLTAHENRSREQADVTF